MYQGDNWSIGAIICLFHQLFKFYCKYECQYESNDMFHPHIDFITSRAVLCWFDRNMNHNYTSTSYCFNHNHGVQSSVFFDISRTTPSFNPLVPVIRGECTLWIIISEGNSVGGESIRLMTEQQQSFIVLYNNRRRRTLDSMPAIFQTLKSNRLFLGIHVKFCRICRLWWSMTKLLLLLWMVHFLSNSMIFFGIRLSNVPLKVFEEESQHVFKVLTIDNFDSSMLELLIMFKTDTFSTWSTCHVLHF